MTRLLLDAMCGGVRSHVRMCGHDAAFTLERGLEADAAIVEAASEEGRTVVTRDRALGALAEDAIVLESLDPDEQRRTLDAAGVDLTLPATPTRCSRCNGLLREVPSAEPTDEYAPDPAETPVWECRDCGQYFWKGSHWERVAEQLGTR